MMTILRTTAQLRARLERPPSASERILLVLLFGILVAVRMPGILAAGRFWAEEGDKFFVYGWSLSPWRALFTPWGGYLNITANFGGILAWHVAPLKYAPYATSLLALTIQLFPAILLVTSCTAWLDRSYVLVAALLIVVMVPVSEEVWISSIGSQVHLSFCVALILALETRGGAVCAFRLFVIALAALSGPGSWLLTPLFAARAIMERDVSRTLQTIVLGILVLVQAQFFYSHEPGRAYAIHPILFLDLAFQKHVLLPFFGPEWLADRANAEIGFINAGFVPWRPAAVMIVIALVVALVIWRDRRSMSFWLFCSAAVMLAVSYAGALGQFSGMFAVASSGRYVYTPQAAIALAILGCAVDRAGFVGHIATIAAAWLLTVGAIYYFIPTNKEFSKGPAWRTELAAHLRNPAHAIASWPPGWHVRMPDDRSFK